MKVLVNEEEYEAKIVRLPPLVFFARLWRDHGYDSGGAKEEPGRRNRKEQGYYTFEMLRDLSVLKEYRKREEELNRAKDLEHITNQWDAQKRKYEGLRKQRVDEFMAGFNLISLKLKEV